MFQVLFLDAMGSLTREEAQLRQRKKGEGDTIISKGCSQKLSIEKDNEAVETKRCELFPPQVRHDMRSCNLISSLGIGARLSLIEFSL